MWSAVNQLDVDCPRLSLHALMKANVKTLDVEKLMRSGEWRNFRIVFMTLEGRTLGIVDEISTTNPGMFVFLERVFRMCFDDSKPFR